MSVWNVCGVFVDHVRECVEYMWNVWSVWECLEHAWQHVWSVC